MVDDASTEEPIVLDAIARDCPTVNVIRLTENVGQSFSSRAGFMASKGAYVIFLDADDFLLPECVEHHVFAHLSWRYPIGLTSCDMFHVVDGKATLAVGQTMSLYILQELRRGDPRRADTFRSVAKSAPRFWTYEASSRLTVDDLWQVNPININWAWSPTSGNCYRRDALDLFIHATQLEKLPRSTDAFLISGISGLTGSVLIDIPLMGYRIHGSNAFMRHPPLNAVLGFDRRREQSALACSLLLQHIVSNIAIFADRIHSIPFLHDLLMALAAKAGDQRLYRRDTLPSLKEVLEAHYSTLVEALGAQTAQDWIAQATPAKSQRKRFPLAGLFGRS